MFDPLQSVTPVCAAIRRMIGALAALPLLLFAWTASADPHTFRYAGQAGSVFLAGEMTAWDKDKRALQPGAAGEWSVTLDLEPGLWLYKYVVDGRWIADPANAMSDNDGLGGRHSVLLHGQGDWMPAEEDKRGRLLTLDFPSEALGANNKVNLYLPKGHTRNRIYPLLLLLHGYGLDADQWVKTGQIQNFLDHAIARGDIPPMIVLLPSSGKVPYTGASETHIMKELLPWVAREYNADTRTGRLAVAGMSMGGMGTLNLAFGHPQRFGVAVPVSTYLTSEYLAALPAKLPRDLRLHVLCGTGDELIGFNRQLAATLKERSVAFRYEEGAGGHDFHYWGGITPRMLKTVGDFFTGRTFETNSRALALDAVAVEPGTASAPSAEGERIALDAAGVAELKGVWEGQWRVANVAASGPVTLRVEEISAGRVKGVSQAYRTNDPANENLTFDVAASVQDGEFVLEGQNPVRWSLVRDGEGLKLITRMPLPELKDEVVSVFRRKP